ncbi:MAG: cbb3-type cytochrome c oxidase subunit I [Magnetococcales bacterium]|nr:cbb3-type cytochrome c oxidase subunit I [Magnetococcales bacterium]MBF0321666.1 cbb3-type cytochrome c oxidase subunit I [Magnetococcales bacterium]
MQAERFALTIPDGKARSLAKGWLFLALWSLIGAGLVVILVVLARTPVIQNLIPWTGSFKTALVIHVDLSVLVWFLAFAGFMGSLLLPTERTGWGFFGLGLAAMGAILLPLTPFLGVDAPFMNNYVPVLENQAFFVAVGLFIGGFLLMAGRVVFTSNPAGTLSQAERAMRFGIRSGMAIAWLAALIWLWTFLVIGPGTDRPAPFRESHYEVLFWGAGHVLQFTHTQIMLVVWLWLATLAEILPNPRPRLAVVALVLGVLPTLAAPAIHAWITPVDGPDLRLAYGELMRYGHGLATLPVGVALLFAWATHRQPAAPEQRPQRLALLLSLLLFGVGGAIGFLIQGVNVTIPSHYHGSIVAITLAYMGLTYGMLPLLGWRRPCPTWSSRQLLLYGVGSLLHVAGLAMAGVHGVQRKTAGAEQHLKTLPEKLAMGCTGLGGVLAVIGGILFLVLTIRACKRRNLP